VEPAKASTNGANGNSLEDLRGLSGVRRLSGRIPDRASKSRTRPTLRSRRAVMATGAVLA
jgi:hypothetical protein